ncbi:MAG: CoA-binding protein [Nitrospinae bacterium]|nr:CoA-binding protein [Nitrospinota bacterium]
MNDACDISQRPEKPEGNPSPEEIRGILENCRTVAVVGLSNKPNRDSYRVALYLADHGYKVIPVNPALEEKGWEGIKAYNTIAQVPGEVDIIDLFRRADSIGELAADILAKKPRVVWLQLGIVNNPVAAILRKAGITVVQDKCIKIEHNALIGG